MLSLYLDLGVWFWVFFKMNTLCKRHGINRPRGCWNLFFHSFSNQICEIFLILFKLSKINQVFHMVTPCFWDRNFSIRAWQVNNSIQKQVAFWFLNAAPEILIDVLIPINKIQQKHVHFLTINFLLIPHNQELRKLF